MSETASAGATSAPAAGAAPAASGQASGGTANPSGGQAPQAQGSANPNTPQGQAQEQRVLAEQDLDAYFEHTVNGKKEKVKARDLLKSYGLDKTANQRMQEAAQIRKQQQQLQHLMLNDFDKYCEVTGVNRDEFLESTLSKRKEIAEKVLAREYELQQMDPNQRKNIELETQLKQFQQREMQTKQPLIDEIRKLVPEHMLPKGMENATADQLKGYLQQKQGEFQTGLDNLSSELLEAWGKTGLPKQKDFGSWMAQTMLDHQKRSTEHKKRTGEELPPLHPEQAALKVKERFLTSTRSLFSQMDASAIQEALGPDIIQKLRNHDVGLASSQGPKFGNQNSPVETTASEPKQYMNQFEWRKAMEKAGNFKF